MFLHFVHKINIRKVVHTIYIRVCKRSMHTVVQWRSSNKLTREIIIIITIIIVIVLAEVQTFRKCSRTGIAIRSGRIDDSYVRAINQSLRTGTTRWNHSFNISNIRTMMSSFGKFRLGRVRLFISRSMCVDRFDMCINTVDSVRISFFVVVL